MKVQVTNKQTGKTSIIKFPQNGHIPDDYQIDKIIENDLPFEIDLKRVTSLYDLNNLAATYPCLSNEAENLFFSMIEEYPEETYTEILDLVYFADSKKQGIEKLDYLVNGENQPFKFLEYFGEVEVYNCNSLAELAREFVDDEKFGEVSEYLKLHLDYDTIGEELGLDGYLEYNGKIFKYE